MEQSTVKAEWRRSEVHECSVGARSTDSGNVTRQPGRRPDGQLRGLTSLPTSCFERFGGDGQTNTSESSNRRMISPHRRPRLQVCTACVGWGNMTGHGFLLTSTTHTTIHRIQHRRGSGRRHELQLLYIYALEELDSKRSAYENFRCLQGGCVLGYNFPDLS